MDPKRKKIYIIVLVVCVALLIGVLIWSSSSGTPETPTPIKTPATSIPASQTASATAPQGKIKTDGAYPAPAVFPQSHAFDDAVITDLKLLKSFNPVKLEDNELGRENPLSDY